MGKTRTICASIIENFANGRKLHLVLTTSTSLELDFRREMEILEFYDLDIFNLKSSDLSFAKEGIIFTTYSMLNASQGNVDLSNAITSC